MVSRVGHDFGSVRGRFRTPGRRLLLLGSGELGPCAAGGLLSKTPVRRLLVVSLLAVGWAAFTSYRIWQGVTNPPAVWQDSLAYRAVSAHGFFGSALWTGPRSPLVPVLMKATDQFRHYGLAQALLGSLAWGVLALTVSRLVRRGWREVVMAWAVLAFATAPLVVQWDWSALSESPSLSVLALLCACGIWLVQRFTWIRLGALGVATLAYVGLRDADIWTMMLLGLVVLGVGVYQMARGAAVGPGTMAEMLRDGWHRTRRWVLVGAVLVAASSLAGAGAYASHRNVINIEEALYVRVFPFPDRVAWFSAHGMPDASQIDAQARTTPSATETDAQVVSIDFADPKWAALQDWFSKDGMTTYALFLLTHPGYDVAAPFDTPPLTYNNASGQLSFYLPTGHHPLAFFETIFAPNRFVVMTLVLLGLAIGAGRSVRRRREWRFFIVFVAVGLFSMLLAWHGEGMEVTRHMVEGDVEVRLGALLLFLLAVLGEAPPSAQEGEAASAGAEPLAATSPRDELFVAPPATDARPEGAHVG